MRIFGLFKKIENTPENKKLVVPGAPTTPGDLAENLASSVPNSSTNAVPSEITNAMQKLTISATKKTPQVSYNSTTGTISLTGKCIPEDANGFWNPIHEGIQTIVRHSTEQNNLLKDIIFQFEYFNTASAKHILDIIKKDVGSLPNDSLHIQRLYDTNDEDMKESGEDYEEIVLMLKKEFSASAIKTRTNKSISK